MASEIDAETLQANAPRAAALMKAMSHPGRLTILCDLLDGERAVSQLEPRVGLSQSALSQHLARLRREGLVATRREAQTIYYRLAEPSVERVIAALYVSFCQEQG